MTALIAVLSGDKLPGNIPRKLPPQRKPLEGVTPVECRKFGNYQFLKAKI